MALKIVTPPATEPITTAEAKAHLRVDSADEDTLIDALIKAARRYCEGVLNRVLISQTWELWLDEWPDDDYIQVPLPPLQSITSVKYYGTDDTEYTLDAADYFVDTKGEPGRIVLVYGESWPSTTLRPANAVCVTFTAGYGDAAADVPQEIKQAILLLVGHWFEHREAAAAGSVPKEIEFAVNALLWLDRVVPV